MFATPIMRAASSAAKPTSFMQRVRNTPPELVPLFGIVGFAVIMGAGAWTHKLINDPTVRLQRMNVRGQNASASSGHH